MAKTAKPVDLKPQTVGAFEEYIREAEAGMERTPHGTSPFFWSDISSERTEQVRGRQVVAQFMGGQGPVKVPNGLIHDWIGAAFIPATNLKKTLARIVHYDHHKNIYKPEVIASRLRSHRSNDFQSYLRLLKRKL